LLLVKRISNWPVYALAFAALALGFGLDGLFGIGLLRTGEALVYPVLALLIIRNLIRGGVEQAVSWMRPEVVATSASEHEAGEAWDDRFSRVIGGFMGPSPSPAAPEQVDSLKAELRLALEELAEVKSQSQRQERVPVGSLTALIEGRADVIASVETAVAQVAGSLEERGQSLHLDLAASLPSVSGDPDELRQILVTLIENAIRASPPGAVIPVSALATDSADGAWVSLSVSDSGGGIPPEDLGRIFHSPEPGRGTESGLARVKQLAEGMGGRVWVGSEVGGGSTVTVLIPARPE
jgi:signal transduction histidine kinase